MKISVCLASYNGSAFIERQVTSILQQLGPEDELIISDDGSSDCTFEIIKQMKDDRIFFLENRGKKGPTGNFENALRRASGDIIFLSDQDDEWLLERVNTHLERHISYDLVLSNARVVNEKGAVLFDSFFDQRGSKSGFINNLMRNSYIGCCMSFNKKILDLSLPFPDYIYMHDWWIGLVAELKGKVFFINQPYLNYTRHGNNASPTLENSKYSMGKRFMNRINLMRGLSKVIFR